jgi:hypothetical protein
MSPINCKKGKLTHNPKQSLFASWLKSWYQKCVHKCHPVRRHHVHKEVQIVCWRLHCRPQELKCGGQDCGMLSHCYLQQWH